MTYVRHQPLALTLNPSPKGRGTFHPAPLLLWEKGLGDEGKQVFHGIRQVYEYLFKGDKGGLNVERKSRRLVYKQQPVLEEGLG